MPEQPFDAYYKWLGIPPSDQPPNFYRLLGVVLYEPDPDVIEAAADQRMAHIRTYQTGKHGAASQKILNELAEARLTLLNPTKKAGYDASLRSQSPSQALSEPPDISAAPSLAVSPTILPSSGPRSVSRRKRSNYGGLAAVASTAVLIVGAALYVVFGNQRTSSERKVATSSSPQAVQKAQRKTNEADKPSKVSSSRSDLPVAPVMPAVMPAPQVSTDPVPLRVLDRKTQTYQTDGSDVAQEENGSFLVSTAAAVGVAAVGYELEGARRLTVDANVGGSLQPHDENSFAGVFVDYHTPAGYSKRVAISLGLHNKGRLTGGPGWGKQVPPEQYVEMTGAEIKELELGEWAPADWDGRVWFSVVLQNSGPATSIEGRLIMPQTASDDAQQRKAERER